MRKKQRTTKEEHKAHETSESRWEEPIDWEKYLMDKEQSIKEEERRLKERKEKAKRLEKSFELLRLCTEVLKEEGEKWAVTKERRELEMIKETEKHERIAKAKNKQKEIREQVKKQTIQTKITEKLAELPSNRRKILEARIETERKLELKEAKIKLWKKSRENKTTKENPITIPKKDSQETLDKKLKKIEEEISKYKEELERIRTEKIKNEERKA